MAGGEPGRHPRRRREQIGRGHGIAHHFRNVDIGHGEAPAHRMDGCRKRGVEQGEGRAQRRNRGLGCMLIPAVGRELYAVLQDLDAARLNFGRGPERPLREQAFLGEVSRPQRAAIFPGEIEIDRERFRQDQPVILHDRHQPRGVELPECRGGGVERCVRRRRIGQAIGLDHRHMAPRQSDFVAEPSIAHRARAQNPVDRDHVAHSSPKGSSTDLAGGVSQAAPVSVTTIWSSSRIPNSP